ncbi:MAG: HAD family hydrolase [Pseudomonadota bacterium]
MWSGPRNLSTAMMYSFAARGDCRIVDEPFYAAYLAETKADHPKRNAVLESQDTSPVEVEKVLRRSISETVFYQKHMAHHILPSWDRSWIKELENVFLIRHPARVVASYARKREAPVLDDLGFVQQSQIYQDAGGGIVIESSDIRRDPRGMLQKLCRALGIPWTNQMLNWPAGGHEADGVWASHWYNAVHASTGFEGVDGPLPDLRGDYARLVDLAMPYYEALATTKLI